MISVMNPEKYILLYYYITSTSTFPLNVKNGYNVVIGSCHVFFAESSGGLFHFHLEF